MTEIDIKLAACQCICLKSPKTCNYDQIACASTYVDIASSSYGETVDILQNKNVSNYSCNYHYENASRKPYSLTPSKNASLEIKEVIQQKLIKHYDLKYQKANEITQFCKNIWLLKY
jgi:hypothetical protein